MAKPAVLLLIWRITSGASTGIACIIATKSRRNSSGTSARVTVGEFGISGLRQMMRVVPGWIMTERQKTLWATPEALEAHRNRQCLPDLIDPVYVARMVLFLASDDGAMCSASNYMVEAGSI